MYLFNHKALAKVFAAKLIAALKAAGLSLPAGLPQQWVVDCKAVGDVGLLCVTWAGICTGVSLPSVTSCAARTGW